MQADTCVALKILKMEKQKKKKKEAARKKTVKEVQKARQLASRALQQNPPLVYQKIVSQSDFNKRYYNTFNSNLFDD